MVQVVADQPSNITCLSPRGKPAANVTWFRNGIPLNETYSRYNQYIDYMKISRHISSLPKTTDIYLPSRKLQTYIFPPKNYILIYSLPKTTDRYLPSQKLQTDIFPPKNYRHISSLPKTTDKYLPSRKLQTDIFPPKNYILISSLPKTTDIYPLDLINYREAVPVYFV